VLEQDLLSFLNTKMNVSSFLNIGMHDKPH